jgi:hypothetical protein
MDRWDRLKMNEGGREEFMIIDMNMQMKFSLASP